MLIKDCLLGGRLPGSLARSWGASNASANHHHHAANTQEMCNQSVKENLGLKQGSHSFLVLYSSLFRNALFFVQKFAFSMVNMSYVVFFCFAIMAFKRLKGQDLQSHGCMFWWFYRSDIVKLDIKHQVYFELGPAKDTHVWWLHLRLICHTPSHVCHTPGDIFLWLLL